MILRRLLCALVLVFVNVWAQEVKKIFEPLDQITLDQITKDNFKNIQIAGSYSTGLGGSTEEEQFA
jgi:glucose dehydrogenase